MRILVTGAAGFVGNAVVKALIARGYEVTGLDRRKDVLHLIEEAGGEAVFADLATPEGLDTLERLAREADGVIHGIKAYWPTDLTTDYDRRRELMLERTREWEQAETNAMDRVIEAYAGTGKPLVFSSTSGIIGDTGDTITDETRELPEVTAYVPFRLQTERKVLAAADRGVRSSALRTAIIYGNHPEGLPLGRPHPLNMHQNLADLEAVGYLEDGETRISAIHVRDYADLFVLAMEKAEPGSLFIGESEEVTARELALALSYAYGYGGATRSWTREEAAEVLGGAELELHEINMRTTSAKARRVLGWKPTAPSMLETAKAEAIARYGSLDPQPVEVRTAEFGQPVDTLDRV